MRLPWNQYFIQHAELASTRSTCLRRKVGAVAVRDNRIISTGYNGPPSGLKHCDERSGCLREQLGIDSGQHHEICRAVHVEMNVVVQAARHGTSLDECDLYCTLFPCSCCVKALIQTGIRRIFIPKNSDYPDSLSKELLGESGLELIIL